MLLQKINNASDTNTPWLLMFSVLPQMPPTMRSVAVKKNQNNTN